ncbi:MAG: hypothetical protein OSB82_13260 [Alphaproteobacteria bacterium]|nr:hypothetical protein [Alphaproteobacteria bacterium]
MTLINRAALLLCLAVMAMAAPVRGQPIGDGEACLEGCGWAILDEAYCRRALFNKGLGAVARAAL